MLLDAIGIEDGPARSELGCRAPTRRPSRAHSLNDWPTRMHARQGACPPRMCTSCRRVSASTVVLTYRGALALRTHPWVHAMLHALRTVRVQPLPASVNTFHRKVWSTTARSTDPSYPLRCTAPPRLRNGVWFLHWPATYRHGAYLREGCAWRMSQTRSTQDASTLSLFIKPCTCWTLTGLDRLFLAAYAVLVLWCACCAVHSAVCSLDASASGRRTLRNPYDSRPRQGGDLPRRCPSFPFPTFFT